MATVDELVAQGALVKIGGGLDETEQPERLLYALPHVIKWIGDNLPDLSADFSGKQTPLEQADELFHDFVSGEDLSFYERSHSMEPTEPGVWELKTPDLRIFGWFKGVGVFVIANIDTAFRCKEHGLYAGYRDDVVRRRGLLDLDEPKFLIGGYDDVL